jgi:uncharacterized protein (TIGR02266 family)
LTEHPSAVPDGSPRSSPPRRQARVPYRIEIHGTSRHNFWTGTTYNVSLGGVFVATESPLPPGSEVTLELRLDAAVLPWRVSGVVRWVRPELHASPEHPAGCGVQFQNLPPEAESAIRAFILHQRESLYFDDGA